jgi:hypothetical protein
MKRSQQLSSAKHLAAIQTSRHFRMSKHAHTGKVLPRTATSYPMLTMIVLIVGVLIGGWTHVVSATSSSVWTTPQSDSYAVNASVPGPAPVHAAIINSPTINSRFKNKPIIVEGSCPIDAAGGYVSIYRNNFYSGTAICDASGSFQVSIDLFTGANQLIARVYNFTDVAGPDSAPTTVYYDPPAQSIVPDGPMASTTPTSKPANQGFSINSAPISTAPATTTVPLTLTTDFTIRGYYVGEQSVWQLDPEGGSAPYAIAIDWGDGSNGIVSRGNPGLTRLTHTFEKAGAFHGSYIVKFTVTDAAGSQTFLQLLVIVNSRQQAAIGRSIHPGGGSGFSNGITHFLKNYIWPSYGLVVLMLLSFWLGERREYHTLKLKHGRFKHA